MSLLELYIGIFLHTKFDLGQRPQGGHGGDSTGTGELLIDGHAGQTGGTISDFNIYLSASPAGIW